MISFEEARTTVISSAIRLPSETVDLLQAQGRVLASPVYSDINMPPFDKSAMDGFAIRRADIGMPIEVLETIPAGTMPTLTVGPGQGSRIMTGARIPEGADCVLKVEETETLADGTIRFTGTQTADNICYFAEDIKAGQLIFKAGTFIKPQHIGVLATVGCAKPEVYCVPRVGIITTGDELVEPDQKPGPSHIRNSNAWQMMSQLLTMGIRGNYYGIIADNVQALDQAIARGLAECDILILTGGVSMGDFDLVPGILKKNQVHILFEKMAVQPGSPTVFGKSKSSWVFGLPGNPVSSFVQFELLVKLLIRTICGDETPTREIALPLGIQYTRNKAHRRSFIPVRISDDSKVFPVEYHGSAHINALTDAHGIISIDAGIKKIDEGEQVHVRLI